MITAKRNLAICIALGLVVSLIAGILVTVPASASVKPDWTQRTCSAFAKWQHKPTETRLERVMRDSTRAPWVGLGGDVWTWYGLERAIQHDKPAQKAGDEQRESVAEQYVGEDCWGGA